MDAVGVAGLDEPDAAQILAERWQNKTASDGDPEADAWIASLHRPFARRFPGLAPPVTESAPTSRMTGS